MPVNFQFTLVETDQTVSLNLLDEEMCEDAGYSLDEKLFCPLFENLKLYFYLALAKWGGMRTDKALVERLISSFQEEFKTELSESVIQSLRKYGYQKYYYTAWL